MPELATEQLVRNSPKMSRVTSHPQINQTQDSDILEIVRDTTFITREQLKSLCARRGLANNRQIFNWRFNRFIKAGLVSALPVEVFPFKGEVYSITREGLAVLETFGKGLASIGSDSEHLASSKQAHHFLTLNEIMFQIDRSFKVQSYMCDRVLRSYNLCLPNPAAKDYDAFVVLDRSGCNKPPLNIGVEYEATIKSMDRYQEISAALNRERQVRMVVYFCGSMNMATSLLDKITSRACLICFGAQGDFLREGAETKMLFSQKQESHLMSLQSLIDAV